MKNLKTLVRVGLATALVAAGAAMASPASAADVTISLDEETYFPGNTVTMTVTGCGADVTSFIDYTVHDGSAGWADSAYADADGTTELTFKAPSPGTAGVKDFSVDVTCTAYYGMGDTEVVGSDSATFVSDFNKIELSPEDWKSGDSLKYTAYGYKPGEAVTLTMVDSTGKVVWTYAAGNADEDGVISFNAVLKWDVPLGEYTLKLTGEESGRVTTRGIRWGDKDDEATAKTGSIKINLPSTGA